MLCLVCSVGSVTLCVVGFTIWLAGFCCGRRYSKHQAEDMCAKKEPSGMVGEWPAAKEGRGNLAQAHVVNVQSSKDQ